MPFPFQVGQLSDAVRMDDWSDREKKRVSWQPVVVSVGPVEDASSPDKGTDCYLTVVSAALI